MERNKVQIIRQDLFCFLPDRTYERVPDTVNEGLRARLMDGRCELYYPVKTGFTSQACVQHAGGRQ